MTAISRVEKTGKIVNHENSGTVEVGLGEVDASFRLTVCVVLQTSNR